MALFTQIINKVSLTHLWKVEIKGNSMPTKLGMKEWLITLKSSWIQVICEECQKVLCLSRKDMCATQTKFLLLTFINPLLIMS